MNILVIVGIVLLVLAAVFYVASIATQAVIPLLIVGVLALAIGLVRRV